MNSITKYIVLPVVMTALLMIAMTPVMAEDYNYVELSQGVKIKNAPWGNSNWNGSCPTALSIGRHWDLNPKTYFRAQFNHTSNICKGAPFSKTPAETWLDQLNITIGIKF